MRVQNRGCTNGTQAISTACTYSSIARAVTRAGVAARAAVVTVFREIDTAEGGAEVWRRARARAGAGNARLSRRAGVAARAAVVTVFREIDAAIGGAEVWRRARARAGAGNARLRRRAGVAARAAVVPVFREIDAADGSAEVWRRARARAGAGNARLGRRAGVAARAAVCDVRGKADADVAAASVAANVWSRAGASSGQVVGFFELVLHVRRERGRIDGKGRTLHDACRDDRRGHGLVGALLPRDGLGEDDGGNLREKGAVGKKGGSGSEVGVLFVKMNGREREREGGRCCE